MNPLRDPKRLSSDPEFREAIGEVQSETFSADRVAAVADRIRTGSPSQLPRSPGGAGARALLRLLGGSGVAAVAVTLAWAHGWRTSPPADTCASVPSATRPSAPPGADRPLPISAATPGSDVAPSHAGAATPVHAAPTIRAAVAIATAAPAPAGDLAEQLARFRAAEQASDHRDFDAALAGLDGLLARWPSTPIRAEVELSRAEVLARAGRGSEAVPALVRLRDDPLQAGRRPEITLLLSDLQSDSGRCDQARDGYAFVAGHGSPEQADAARAGLLRCDAIH